MIFSSVAIDDKNNCALLASETQCKILFSCSCYFMMKLLAVHIIFFITITGSLSEDALLWDNHVYTGHHLDDSLTTPKYGPPTITTNGLFIMYKPKCQSQINDLKSELLPPIQYMVFGKHDYETFPKAIWYQLDGRDDLVQRYKPDGCLKVMFFRRGSNIHDPEVYNAKTETNIIDWVWEKFQINFIIVNTRKDDILVGFSEWIGDRNQSLVVVRPGENITFHTFVSRILYVLSSKEDKLLFGKVVEFDFPSRIIIDGYVIQLWRSSVTVAYTGHTYLE